MAFQILCFFKLHHNSFAFTIATNHYQIENDSSAVDSFAVAVISCVQAIMKYCATKAQYC